MNNAGCALSAGTHLVGFQIEQACIVTVEDCTFIKHIHCKNKCIKILLWGQNIPSLQILKRFPNHFFDSVRLIQRLVSKIMLPADRTQSYYSCKLQTMRVPQ
jgi:hypothetical protein